MINLLIISLFSKKLEYGYDIDDDYFDSRHPVLLFFSALHLTTGFVQIIIWSVVKAPLNWNQGWEKIYRTYNDTALGQVSKEDIVFDKLEAMQRQMKDDTSYSPKEFLKEQHSKMGREYSTPTMESKLLTLEIFANDPELKHILTNFTISIFAISNSLTFFYGIQLFQIISHFDVLKYVVRSVTNNSIILMLTFILGLNIVLFFTEIGFEFFPEDYYMTSIEKGENNCSTMYF